MALFLQRLGAYGVAVLATEALAAMASTQFVLAGLTSLGVVITFSDRLTMTGQDILGMMQVYLPVLALALALVALALLRSDTALTLTALVALLATRAAVTVRRFIGPCIALEPGHRGRHACNGDCHPQCQNGRGFHQ